MKKVIITAAITGAIHTPSMSPYLPVTPEQIADEAIKVHEAGGAVAHIHVRDRETGYPTRTRMPIWRSQLESRRNVTLFFVSPRGAGWPKPVEKRLKVVSSLKPEMSSLNAGL